SRIAGYDRTLRSGSLQEKSCNVCRFLRREQGVRHLRQRKITFRALQKSIQPVGLDPFGHLIKRRPDLRSRFCTDLVAAPAAILIKHGLSTVKDRGLILNGLAMALGA